MPPPFSPSDAAFILSKPNSVITYTYNGRRNGRVHRFERTASLSSYSTSTGGPTNAVYQFALSDTDNYTELTALFDQYKIDYVDLTFVPFYTESIPGTGECAGVVYSAPDFDDNSATAAAALRQYSGVQCHKQVDPFAVRIKPRAAMALYSGSVFTQFGNIPDPWIDANSPGVPHYGFKLAADASGGTAQTWQVLAKYHISCMSSR